MTDVKERLQIGLRWHPSGLSHPPCERTRRGERPPAGDARETAYDQTHANLLGELHAHVGLRQHLDEFGVKLDQNRLESGDRRKDAPPQAPDSYFIPPDCLASKCVASR